jgi:formylglycine-generating enzyme required for sulfatase activity
MKLPVSPVWAFLVILFVLHLSSSLLAQTVNKLQLERSTDLKNWEAVPISSALINADGQIALYNSTSEVFFRLKLRVVLPWQFAYVAAGTMPSSSRFSGQSVAAFYIAKTETTWGQWQSVLTYAAANGYDIGSVGAGNGTDYPVTNVSWFHVVKWCNARSEQEGLTPVYRVNNLVYKTGDSAPTVDATANGYRLPTEAQWEFAARGGVSTQNFEYSGSNDVNAVAWYDINSGGTTHPVGTKLANELGVSDMSGNVREWCESLYNLGSDFRINRGGSWKLEAARCHVASWGNGRTSYVSNNFGFRVACSSVQ